MSETLLFRLYRGQVKALQETVEAWQAEHHHAMMARGIEDIVRVCLDAPAIVKRVWNETFAKIRDGEVEDHNETRRELWTLIDNILGILDTVRGLALSWEQKGNVIAGTADLERVIAEVQKQQHFIFEHWSEFSQETVDRAQAEYARGEFLELFDAFASIAGVDRATWLKRVEEHKRKYHGGEQGNSR